MLLLPSADFFQNIFFSKHSFMNTIRVSNGLDQDQDRRSVRSDLGPNCLQRLSVATSKERVKTQDRFTFWGNLGRRKLFAEI